jgi:hypothetical protein
VYEAGVHVFIYYYTQSKQPGVHEAGVHVYEALMWTINDFPAYEMLSGWSMHGKLACPYCMENNKAFTLPNGGKLLFLLSQSFLAT